MLGIDSYFNLYFVSFKLNETPKSSLIIRSDLKSEKLKLLPVSLTKTTGYSRPFDLCIVVISTLSPSDKGFIPSSEPLPNIMFSK